MVDPEDTVSGGLDFAQWLDDTYCYVVEDSLPLDEAVERSRGDLD
jgi:hypothetical protein